MVYVTLITFYCNFLEIELYYKLLKVENLNIKKAGMQYLYLNPCIRTIFLIYYV